MSYHIPGTLCVGVTVWFFWGGVVYLYRLKHYWSVRVGCWGWGLMAVWNSGSSKLKILVLHLTISTCRTSRRIARVSTQGVSGRNVKMNFKSYWRVLRSSKALFSTYAFLPKTLVLLQYNTRISTAIYIRILHLVLTTRYMHQCQSITDLSTSCCHCYQHENNTNVI